MVYWSVFQPSGLDYFLNIEEPRSVISYASNLSTSGDPLIGFMNCPAFLNNAMLTYNIESPINYSVMWDGLSFNTWHSDTDFLEKNTVVRSMDKGVFSFLPPQLIFFTGDESMDMLFSGGHYSTSDFSSKVNVMSGMFDIGKWFRPTDCTFIFKNKSDPVIINRGDVISSVRFFPADKKKVVLKRFYMNDNLLRLSNAFISHKNFNDNSNYNIMQYFDNVTKNVSRLGIKKQILREIKNNLMD